MLSNGSIGIHCLERMVLLSKFDRTSTAQKRLGGPVLLVGGPSRASSLPLVGGSMLGRGVGVSIFTFDTRSTPPSLRRCKILLRARALRPAAMRGHLLVLVTVLVWAMVVLTWPAPRFDPPASHSGTVWPPRVLRFLRGSSSSRGGGAGGRWPLLLSPYQPVVGGGLVAATLAACAGCWAYQHDMGASQGSSSRGSEGSCPASSSDRPHPLGARRAAAAANGEGGTGARAPAFATQCPAWLQRQLPAKRGLSRRSSSSGGGGVDTGTPTVLAMSTTASGGNTTSTGAEEGWEALGGVEGWEWRSVGPAVELQDAFFHPETTLLKHGAGTRDGLSWMAADVASSMQLAEGRFLWIFGDTFLSRGANVSSWDRKGGVHAFPRQSLAEVSMRPGGHKDAVPPARAIRFLWKEKGRPADTTSDKQVLLNIPGSETPQAADASAASRVVSFFEPSRAVVGGDEDEDEGGGGGTGDKSAVVGGEPEHPEAWYWVINGVRPGLQGPAVFMASVVVRTKDNELGFAITGTGAIRVNNPDHHPQAWEYDQVRVPGSSSGPQQLNWFSGVAVDGPWALLVGQQGSGLGVRQVLGRLPVPDFVALDFSKMQVWGHEVDDKGTPEWMPLQRYLDAASGASPPSPSSVDLVNLLEGNLGVTEVSLVHDPRLDQWLMTTLPPFENKVMLWTAPQPMGPWTRTVVLDIEKAEAAAADGPAEPKRRLYYAAKLHPELSGADDVVLTYCANVLGDWPTPKDYTPRFFRLQLRRRTNSP